MVHLLKLMNQHWLIIINQSPYFMQISLVFILMFSFCSRFHSRLSHYILVAMSPVVSLGCDLLLRLHFCLMTLTILRSVSGVRCPYGGIWHFLMVPTVYMGSWEEGHRGNAILIILYYLRLSTVELTSQRCWVNLDHCWGGVCQFSPL